MVLYGTVGTCGTCTGVSKTSVSKGPNAIDQPRETSSFDANDSWETSKRVFQVFFSLAPRIRRSGRPAKTSENAAATTLTSALTQRSDFSKKLPARAPYRRHLTDRDEKDLLTAKGAHATRSGAMEHMSSKNKQPKAKSPTHREAQIISRRTRRRATSGGGARGRRRPRRPCSLHNKRTSRRRRIPRRTPSRRSGCWRRHHC